MSKQLTPEFLHHLATCDEGGLRWMTGRCMPAGYASVELYAMPGFGRAPALVLKADADARIAELEGVLAKALAFTEANTFGGADALELIEECHDALAGQQRAESKVCTKPGCFPYCDCGTIDDYMPPAATHSEDGGEVVTDIADLFADSKCVICGDTGHFIVDDTGTEYVTSPCPECNAPDAWRMFDGEGGYDYTHDEETAERWKKHCGEKYASWVEPLYLSAPSGSQHARIVAAKDAEIARLNLELKDADKHGDREELRANGYAAELVALRAQPARQVGGDERTEFGQWFCDEFKKLSPSAGVAMHLAKELYWTGWKARAALAPAAVCVIPEALRLVELLGLVAEKAFHLADGTQEDLTGETPVFTVDGDDFQALSDALDKCDEEPEIDDVYARDGWLMVLDKLRALLAQWKEVGA